MRDRHAQNNLEKFKSGDVGGPTRRKLHSEIKEHNEKRAVEVKVMKRRLEMKKQGYSAEEVEREVGDTEDWPRRISNPVASFAKYTFIIASNSGSDDFIYMTGRQLC